MILVRRPPAWAAWGALVVASIGLFFVSRGKWSDAIIDSGREWMVPDALARGDLLYRDVVYWFGPVTPYVHAILFRIFGSSFGALVAAGVVGSLAVLGALYMALRTVTGKAEAALWTTLAVPALVFMPNAGGSILGMGYRIWHAAAFTLVAVSLAARRSRPEQALLAAVGAGAASAAAGLCRTEWGLIALVSVCASLLLGARPAPVRLRSVAAASVAFAVVFAAVLGGFIAAAGWKAVVSDGHVLLLGVPEETRTFLLEYSGIRDWKSGSADLVYSGAVWTGAVLLLHVLAVGSSNRPRVAREMKLLGGILLLVLLAALAGAGSAVTFSAAPLVSAAAAAFAVARNRPASPALAGFGLAGALSSFRRPFHIADAAYVGPPLLFAFVCAAGLLQIAFDGEKDAIVREKLRGSVRAAVAILVIAAFASRFIAYRADPRVPVPGTQGMISALPERVARLSRIAEEVRRSSRPGEGLVVFPEGELLNYLSKRPNALRHKLYIPGYLTEANETDVLADLMRSPPTVIVVMPRQTSEYGPGTFGTTYGKTIRRWIDEKYRALPVSGAERRSGLGLWVSKVESQRDPDGSETGTGK